MSLGKQAIVAIIAGTVLGGFTYLSTRNVGLSLIIFWISTEIRFEMILRKRGDE